MWHNIVFSYIYIYIYIYIYNIYIYIYICVCVCVCVCVLYLLRTGSLLTAIPQNTVIFADEKMKDFNETTSTNSGVGQLLGIFFWVLWHIKLLGCLMPNQCFTDEQFYFEQISLA